MSFRTFKRTAWQVNPDWPNGFEPLAVPMDRCNTLKTVDTIDEARAICQKENDKRPYQKRRLKSLNPNQRRSKMLAPYCEFTEV